MFQNINIDNDIELEDNVTDKGKKGKQIFSNIITKQNIILYVLSFMISTVGWGGVAPFGIAILASSCSNGIPIGIIYILTCIGSLIGLGKEVFLGYLAVSVVFFILMLVKRPKQEEIEKRKKLGIHVFIASLIGQVAIVLFQRPILVYNLLECILGAIIATVFYKIFTGSLNVIRDWGSKKAFSVEEVLGTSLMIAIAVAGFKDFGIFGYSIKNILSILIVLILGWQNGILVGATSGVTIGVVLGIIGNTDPIQIAAYALSGMLAGLFNRLGKIGVIVGFFIGNILLSYVSNGNTEIIIMFQEILIASIGLLAIPKTVKIDIDDLFGKRKCLPVTIDKRLEQKEDAIYKLNTVSDAISEVAKTYQEVAATVVEEDEELIRNRNIFTEELKRNLENMQDNLLYDELVENSEILEDIFENMLHNDIMIEKDLVEIFANHNNYIVGIEGEDTDYSIKTDLNAVVKAINVSYRISKIDFIWKKRVEENKKSMGNQLEGISKAISSIAQDLEGKQQPEEPCAKKEKEIRAILMQKGIALGDVKIAIQSNGRYMASIYLDTCNENEVTECKAEQIQKILEKAIGKNMILQDTKCPIQTENKICNLNYVEEDKYKLKVAIARRTKEESSVSGDTSIQTRLKDGKHLVAISDGMGSGPEAKRSSKIAIKMLQRLLSSGFDKEISMKLINSTIEASSSEETYATLDIAILDLYQGNMEMIKNAACPTYIKNGKRVDIIKTMSLPAGIIDNLDVTVYDRDLQENDIIVMCTDGIIESNQEYKNQELWLKYLLEDMETTEVQKIADIIMQEAVDNGYGIAKDDMTVIVCKVQKK